MLLDITTPDAVARIRDLNDNFRTTFAGGVVVLTIGVETLCPEVKAEVLRRVRDFSRFTADNDPHGEHDFGAVAIGPQKFFWKIDLYEEPDVKDANGEPVVTRVLTLMLAEEY